MDRWLAGRLKRSESSITDTESTSDHPVAKQKRKGSAVSVFKVQHKVQATIRKLAQWKKRVDQGNYDSFENMSDFLTKEETRLPNTVTNAVKEHLEGLKTQLHE
ncbi:Zinc finger BED domain-containing protein 5 [Scomber scombrus]|uniref:Zinc finger BED domain-containing protein 5 n=1 Tax=Scomber scombrus TaxID=13677 RepID=A0AAV1Q336_SCOSC